MFDDRLKNLRKAKGATQADVAEALGIGESAYSNYEKDLREPNAVILKSMSRYFGVTIDYLLDCHTGFIASKEEQEHIKKYRSLDPYGQKAVTSVLDIEFERCLEANQKKIQHTRLIDFIDIPVSAGIGTYLDDERREQKEIIDSDLADRADFILRIDGDSMEPKYHSGEYVFVKKQDAVDLGQICIYYVDGKGYMKKYGGDRLISLNSKYDDILFSDHDIDEISCFGLVLGEAEVVE